MEANAATLSPATYAELLASARELLTTDPLTALSQAERCVALATTARLPRDAAVAGRVRGQALRASGQHAAAVQALSDAAKAAGAAGDPLLAAQVQLGSIDSLTMLGRISEATRLGNTLVRQLRDQNAFLDAAKALTNLGTLYLRQDQYAEAIRCFAEAEVAFDPAVHGEDGVGPIGLMRARVQVNRAIALTHLNDTDTALALYEAARDAYAAAEYAGEVAVIETNIAFIHQMSGWYAAALAHLNRAYPVFVAQGRTVEAARCDIDRGEAYRSLNLFPEAAECYGRAVATFETLPVDYDRARAELGRAAVLFAQGKTDEGLQALSAAEAVFRALRNRTQQAHVHLVRATALHAQEQTEAARTLASVSNRFFTRRRLRGWAAEARFLVATMEMAEGKDVTRTLRAISRTAQRERRGWLECRAEQALARLEQRRGRPGWALRHLRRSVAVLESERTRIVPEELHTAFLSDKESVYADLVGFLIGRGRPKDFQEALEYAERSRSRLLLDRLAAAREQVPGAEAPDGRLTALRGALNRAQQNRELGDADDPRRFVETSPDDIAALEHEYAAALRDAQLDRTLSPQNPLFREEVAWNETAPVATLQEFLTDDEAMVVFYGVPEGLVAFVVRKEQFQVVPLAVSHDEINKIARRLRYHLHKVQTTLRQAIPPLQAALRRETDGILSHLYDYLLRPLEPIVASAARLILVPFGPLHSLPFHAFHDGERYVLDRWEVSYAPSATVWHRLKNVTGANDTNRARNVVLVGVPAPGIEAVATEVEALSGTFLDSIVLLQDEATPEKVTEAAANAEVLHIAAHAVFRKDNPQFSGIQLSEGWLLARDLYELTLPGSLVTLSACETAISQVQSGDELFGLVRGFLSAGARAVVGSFWPADDTATAYLMTAFYRERQQGHSEESALHRAQRATRERFPHPYHWAAFGLIGNGVAPPKR